MTVDSCVPNSDTSTTHTLDSTAEVIPRAPVRHHADYILHISHTYRAEVPIQIGRIFITHRRQSSWPKNGIEQAKRRENIVRMLSFLLLAIFFPFPFLSRCVACVCLHYLETTLNIYISFTDFQSLCPFVINVWSDIWMCLGVYESVSVKWQRKKEKNIIFIMLHRKWKIDILTSTKYLFFVDLYQCAEKRGEKKMK